MCMSKQIVLYAYTGVLLRTITDIYIYIYNLDENIHLYYERKKPYIIEHIPYDSNCMKF